MGPKRGGMKSDRKKKEKKSPGWTRTKANQIGSKYMGWGWGKDRESRALRQVSTDRPTDLLSIDRLPDRSTGGRVGWSDRTT